MADHEHSDPDDPPEQPSIPAPADPPPDPPAPRHTSGVPGWISEAVQILHAQGYRTEQIDAEDIATIIRYESSGNPSAVNDWDSNAARGTPSMGLMQTIRPTFERWHLPGHDNILDPVDNIIAGVRYAVARYGSVSQTPGIRSLATGGPYRGF
jgi:SLT domain-containing protein